MHFVLVSMLFQRLAFVVAQNGPKPVPVSNQTLPFVVHHHELAASHLQARSSSLLVKTVQIDSGPSLSYVAQVDLNGDRVSLLLDTGSSDIFCTTPSFRCVPGHGPIGGANCHLGKPCQPSRLRPAIDARGQASRDLIFDITFGDGEYIKGQPKLVDITIGGLKSKQQQINLANEGKFIGGGVASGVMGLGLDSGSVYHAHGKIRSPYATFITKMRKENALQHNLFSLAINPNNHKQGVLVFGGRPADITTFGDTACVGLVQVKNGVITAARDPTQYLVKVDDVSAKGHSLTGHTGLFSALIDSGTSGIIMPPALARQFNSLWAPASGQMAPELTFTIGGVPFRLRPADLVFEAEHGRPRSSAVSAAAKNDNMIILGNPFFKNAIAMFDVTQHKERILFASTNPATGDSSQMHFGRCKAAH